MPISLAGGEHGWLIDIHAIAGVACFAAGVMAMRPPIRAAWLRGFSVSLLVMVAAMAAVVGVDWSSLPAGTAAAYLGLLALALYMAWRAGRAARLIRRRPPGWTARYLDHIGFVLISLFDGFVIVGAIDLGAPGWLTAAVAVAGVAGGIVAVNRVKGWSAKQLT